MSMNDVTGATAGIEESFETSTSYDETEETLFSAEYLEELRKLLGFQYYFLSRVYAKSGELPTQSFDDSMAEVDQLLAEVFSEELKEEEREAAHCSLEIFFESARALIEEQGEFPRFDDTWERFEALVCEQAGEEMSDEGQELAS